MKDDKSVLDFRLYKNRLLLIWRQIDCEIEEKQ